VLTVFRAFPVYMGCYGRLKLVPLNWGFSNCSHSCFLWSWLWHLGPHCLQEKFDATVILLTVWRLDICVNQSLAPASLDFLILKTQIPHLPMAAWTLSQVQQTSATPNWPKTIQAPPCPHWNAVTKTCAITEGYMTSSLLPRVKPQVGRSLS
jgi:hypothetical protein